MNQADLALLGQFEHSTELVRQDVEELLIEREAMSLVILAFCDFITEDTVTANTLQRIKDTMRHLQTVRETITARHQKREEAANAQPDGSCIPHDAVPVGDSTD